MEIVSENTIKQEIQEILSNPREQLFKGLKATILRETIFSLAHYNAYRFIKDDIFSASFSIQSTFIPAFIAGALAITLSQPFEVIRNHVSLQKGLTVTKCAQRIITLQGWKGFFIGFIPRLMRKPVNSGICWTILEAV